jgi:tyrosine-protein kinase
MKLSDALTAIKRRYWIIIALVVIPALIGAIAAAVQTPVYEVRINMAAEAPKSPVTKMPDPTTAFALAASMQAISTSAESIEIAKSTSEKLKASGINISPQDLQDKVTSGFETNTTAMTLDFQDSSPTRVAQIANTWGDEASRIISAKPLMLGGSLVVTNEAVPPKSPTMPKPFAYIGLGIFLGLVFGVSLAIGLEYFDPHFRSSEETEEMLSLPVIGILPREKTLSSWSNTVFSNIRTSLLLSQDEKEHKSILVASVMPNPEIDQVNAGSQVTVNLAMSIARARRKTLLVDSNLKEATVSELLGAEGLAGLTDALLEHQPLKGLIAQTSTENLYLLPAGSEPIVPADILSTATFQEILRTLEKDYDVVVLDGPPLFASMDAAIIARNTTSNLVVIDVRNCTRNGTLKALEGFERFEIKPTGVILTNVKLNRLERVLTDAAH